MILVVASCYDSTENEGMNLRMMLKNVCMELIFVKIVHD